MKAYAQLLEKSPLSNDTRPILKDGVISLEGSFDNQKYECLKLIKSRNKNLGHEIVGYTIGVPITYKYVKHDWKGKPIPIT